MLVAEGSRDILRDRLALERRMKGRAVRRDHERPVILVGTVEVGAQARLGPGTILAQLDRLDRLVPPGIVLDHTVELPGALAQALAHRIDRGLLGPVVQHAGIELHQGGEHAGGDDHQHRDGQDQLTVDGDRPARGGAVRRGDLLQHLGSRPPMQGERPLRHPSAEVKVTGARLTPG